MRLSKVLALFGFFAFIASCGNPGVDGEVGKAECEGKIDNVDVCSVVMGTDTCSDGFKEVKACKTNTSLAKCVGVKIEGNSAVLFFRDQGSKAQTVCETEYKGTWSTDL